MDSPFARGGFDSPHQRSQEANHGQASNFSLGPAMHDPGSLDISPSPDTPQSTADLTAFVQNLLQQMQLRFQSMSDAILMRIDEMAVRIEDLERSVEEVLREVMVADGDQVALPSPSSSPIRRAMVSPASPDVRKYSIGPPGTFPAVSPLISRYQSAATSMSSPGPTSLNSPDIRRHSASNTHNVPSSPDHRRHSLSGVIYPPGATDSRQQLQQSSGTLGPASPVIRRASSLANVPNSPDTRRRLEMYLSGSHLR